MNKAKILEEYLNTDDSIVSARIDGELWDNLAMLSKDIDEHYNNFGCYPIFEEVTVTRQIDEHITE